MDEPTPTSKSTQAAVTAEPRAQTEPNQADLARGSGVIAAERTEHSVMEGLPKDKAERVAAMRRELADLQKQLIEAQQRIATELQGRVDDAERVELLETQLQAQQAEIEKAKTRAAELEIEVISLRAKVEEASNNEAAQRELEELRKAHRELSEQLDLQFTALRDANAAVVSRGTEIASITTERDALKAELEQTKRDLEVARGKARDIANMIVRFGQELSDGGVSLVVAPTVAPETQEAEAKPVDVAPAEAKPIVTPPPIKRSAPPPLPVRPVIEQEAAEEILDLTAEPKPSGLRSMLLLVGGLIVGCAATFGIMRELAPSSSAAAASDVATPSAPIAAPAEPARIESAPAAATKSDEPAQPSPSPSFGASTAPSPIANNGADTPSAETATPPAAVPAPAVAAAAPSGDGTIVLPGSAAGHRVYVDGKVIDVKGSRATVSCGPHEIRVGSSGATQKVDVACGAETPLLVEAHDAP